jgi:hypothetical protein
MVVLTLLIFIVCINCECGIIPFNDAHYDLTPLKGVVNKVQSFPDETSGTFFDYDFNVCENISLRLCNGLVSGACQYLSSDPSHNTNVSLGYINSITPNSGGFVTELIGGSNGLSVTITVVCDAIEYMQVDKFNSQMESMHWIARIKSNLACAISPTTTDTNTDTTTDTAGPTTTDTPTDTHTDTNTHPTDTTADTTTDTPTTTTDTTVQPTTDTTTDTPTTTTDTTHTTSTTTDNTNTTQPATTGSPAPDQNVLVLVGIISGSVALVAIFIIAVCVIYRRNRAQYVNIK